MDLGIDKVKVFAFDAAKGTIDDDAADDIDTPPGTGPRHIAVAPDGKFAYVCGELDSTVNVIEFGGKRGKVVQSLSTLPEGRRKGNSTAECILSPERQVRVRLEPRAQQHRGVHGGREPQARPPPGTSPATSRSRGTSTSTRAASGC